MKVKGSATKAARRPSRTKADTSMEKTHTSEQEAIARGGVATPFPWKLHEMLEDAAKEGNEWIVSWQSHGRSFIVHKPKIFVEKIMPTYFNQSKFASFQRQLNLYGFCRLTAGKDKGAYYHNCFVRGQVSLCRGMVRQKIKGTKVRRTLAPEEEPDFYKLANMTTPTMPALEAHPGSPEGSDSVVRNPIAPSSPKNDVLSAKERAHKLRQDRLNAVRDALEQTEMFCNEVCNDDDTTSEDPRASISLKNLVPSVSPLESEESDSDESSVNMFSHHHRSKKIPAMPPLLSPPVLDSKLEALAPRFHEMTSAQIQGGDLLFFEGKPFHYLEHLDSLPPAAAVVKPKPSGFSNAFPARDTLHSLMRVDPQSLMGGSFMHVPNRQSP